MRPVDFKVDMDAVKGRQPPPPDEQKRPDNNHIVKIRCTKKVRLEAVRAYLDGRASFDTSVLEGISKNRLFTLLFRC